MYFQTGRARRVQDSIAELRDLARLKRGLDVNDNILAIETTVKMSYRDLRSKFFCFIFDLVRKCHFDPVVLGKVDVFDYMVAVLWQWFIKNEQIC